MINNIYFQLSLWISSKDKIRSNQKIVKNQLQSHSLYKQRVWSILYTHLPVIKGKIARVSNFWSYKSYCCPKMKLSTFKRMHTYLARIVFDNPNFGFLST